MSLKNQIIDLLFPPRCVFCHRFLEKNENGICCDCISGLPLLEKKEREQKLPGIMLCTSLFRYEGDVRSSILRYKFQGLSFYSRKYGDLLAGYLDNEELSCDVVTWVPLSGRRLRSRGYDQAKLLACQLAKQLDLPCISLLRKIRNAAPQSGSGGREERKSNIKGAYRIIPGYELSGKTILLVDDIVTTGATLSECASVLLAAGAAQVKAVTLARTDLTI